MLKKNLIIQGLRNIVTLDLAIIQRIAQLCHAEKMVPLSNNGSHAVKLENVQCDHIQFEFIENECYLAHLDVALVNADIKLSDFRLVAMDMDSTLITIECIDEIADMQGLKAQVSEITEAAMRGELEFQESLIRRVALLKGLDESALERVYKERLQLSLGAENMLSKAQELGMKTLLVSGGFSFFTERLQARLNLDRQQANLLESKNGKLTGKVLGPIIDAQAKQNAVRAYAEELGIEKEHIIVMGDGANDLKMMEVAGLSIAFRAKPIVRKQAKVALNFVGLDGMLNLFQH
jgi:phosphoserine phosphatase